MCLCVYVYIYLSVYLQLYICAHTIFTVQALEDVLNFYFMCCSIQTTSRQLGVVAATLANGGLNPGKH